MNQVRKFYLASFLKNQTYFVPILVIFFQDLGLSYSEIFWVMTAGAAFSFVAEIPTGIIADLYGKRTSIIVSKAIIAISFLFFAFAGGFSTLLLANLVYELGKSFRSGTETAYAYDYLDQTEGTPTYTRVKAMQKFYARLSEAIATALGGLIATQIGFSAAFFFAFGPALINFIQTLTWEKLASDGKHTAMRLRDFSKNALATFGTSRVIFLITANIVLFNVALVALGTFIQPYMVENGIRVEYFGFIYSGFLVAAALLTRFASNLEERFGGNRMINILTLLAGPPLLIIGFGINSVVGIAALFFVLLVENIRSPITNNVFHEQVSSSNRATMGSILELFKTGTQLLFLPLVGYFADLYSLHTAVLFCALLIFIVASVLWLRKVSPKTQTA